MPSSNKKKKKKTAAFWLMAVAVIALAAAVISAFIPEMARNKIYPDEYDEYVSEYSGNYNIDKNFIYAIIKTESNFNEKAQSEVGARGLMQIMEDAYEWVKFRISDDRELTYDQMFEPQYNIEYGCFMLGYYYEKYGCFELAAAAYHSGMGSVDGWISDGIIDPDDLDVSDIPSDKTRHYVRKVMKAFDAYNNLYDKNEI